MNSIVKAADARQFLTVVPRLFGFTPTQSIVIIPFSDGRSAGGMRVDLPRGPSIDATAATLVGMVCRVEGADAFAFVVYTDTSPTASTRALAASLQRRADACGLRVVDGLHVGPARWESYAPGTRGGDVDELCDLDLSGDLGSEPIGDQHTGVELEPAPLEQRDLVTQALQAIERAVSTPPASTAAPSPRIDPAALRIVDLLEDLPAFFDAALSAGAKPWDPYAQAALLWCLHRPALRDIGITTWAVGLDAGDDAVEGQLRWEAGLPFPEDAARHMWGDGPRPDPGRLEAALGACRMAVSVAPDGMRAGALATCAWLSWALGRASHAGHYTGLARQEEPAHGLAMIVAAFVAASHLPEWAFRR